jgi:RHS repeat-associated protein
VTQFWTVNTYDELSRVTGVTLPGNQAIQTAYSGATATSGATVIATDTVGRRRKSEVDGLGRLVKVTEQNPANGNLEWETIYSYDALDNLTQVNQGGQLRTFAYDAKGRLTSETTPEAGTATYTYTDFDAVSTRRDARGVITTYTYGDLNLLTGVSYNTVTGVAPTAPVSLTYRNASPGKGQPETVTDGLGSESYGYDSFGRLQSCTRVIDGISYQKQYEYNEANQMTLMTYPSGKRVKMEHDARGRMNALQSVDASGNASVDASGNAQEPYLSGINYRVDGQVSSQNLDAGTTESFGYSDDRLQLTSQTVTKGGNTLLSLSYGYGAGAGQMGSGSTSGNSGQLVSVSGTINGQNRNQAFTYDNVGRLVTATGWGAWARRFDYDRYGNRTAVWDAVSGGNQLQNMALEQVGGIKTNRIASVNGTAFGYDASGAVTGDGARTYTYDAENRVVSVSGLSSESYGYDAGNRRVKKVVGGVVTHYIWEGDQVIAEYERGGANTPATGTRYYHQDGLSTRVITDGAGNVVGTTDHLPFGEEVGGSGEGKKHKFTTYERDGTGLDYAVNRHYDSRQGRFNQVDPLGIGASSLANPQSLNLYSYVQNDPINFNDPTGLRLEDLVPMSVPDEGSSLGRSLGSGGGGGIGFCSAQYSYGECGGSSGLMSGNFGDGVAEYSREYGGLSGPVVEALMEHNERVGNAFAGNGYRTTAEIERATNFNIYYWIYDDGSYATYFNLPVSDAEAEQRRQSHIRSAADDLLYSNTYAIDLSAKAIPLGLGETNPIIRNYNNFADSTFGSALMAITPLPIKGGVIATYSKSLLGHIFRNALGHVNPATIASQARYMTLFESVAANSANLRTNFPLPTAAANAGVQAFTQTFRNGKQAWVYVRGGKIIDAGINLLGAHR